MFSDFSAFHMDSSVPDKNSSPPTEALFFSADSLLVHIVLDENCLHPIYIKCLIQDSVHIARG